MSVRDFPSVFPYIFLYLAKEEDIEILPFADEGKWYSYISHKGRVIIVLRNPCENKQEAQKLGMGYVSYLRLHETICLPDKIWRYLSV